jgi:hypothetical protein
MLRRALVRFRYGVSTLLLEFLAIAAFAAALVVTAALLFILAAQFTRLASTGDWRGVALSEFFEIIRIGPTESAGFILAFPATLVLFVAALGFWIVRRAMNRIKRREQERFHSSRQKALIGDIEREFEKNEDVKERQIDRN